MKITIHTTPEEAKELGKTCNKSGHCCKYSGGIVLNEDIPRISTHLEMTEEGFKKHYLNQHTRFNTTHWILNTKKTNKPYGPCIFLDKNLCSIHEVKPLYCKVGTCCDEEVGDQLIQWFNIHHFVNIDDPVSLREWALSTENKKLIQGAHIKELLTEEEYNAIMTYQELQHNTKQEQHQKSHQEK